MDTLSRKYAGVAVTLASGGGEEVRSIVGNYSTFTRHGCTQKLAQAERTLSTGPYLYLAHGALSELCI